MERTGPISAVLERVPVWLLVLTASLGMNVCLVLVFGISDGGDSGRYYDSAVRLLDGELPGGKARSYLGYSAFVTPFVALGLGKTAIGTAQILVSAAASVCLYLLGRRFYGTRVGTLAALLFIAFPDIQYWNLIIYADSLFTSMLIVSSYLLLTARSRKLVLLALLAALYTCTIRPHGVGFAAALVVYGIYLLWLNRNYRLLGGLAAALAVVAPLAWSPLGAMIGHERVLDIYASGEITWGYKDNALEMPGEISDRTMDIDHPLLAIGAFIMEKPGYFLELFSNKLWSLFSHYRPYYSGFHNALSFVYLSPAYIFALVGLPGADRQQRAPRVLLVSTFVFLTLVTALTFTDWDGRFLIPMLFVVFLFAANGFWRVVGSFRGILVDR